MAVHVKMESGSFLALAGMVYIAMVNARTDSNGSVTARLGISEYIQIDFSRPFLCAKEYIAEPYYVKFLQQTGHEYSYLSMSRCDGRDRPKNSGLPRQLRRTQHSSSCLSSVGKRNRLNATAYC